MRTRVWNMRILRSGPIGSISAWLPSRKSTLHQIGALVMVRPGHLRSGKLNGWNGLYLVLGSTRMADILKSSGSNLFNNRFVGWSVTRSPAAGRHPGPGGRREVAAAQRENHSKHQTSQ